MHYENKNTCSDFDSGIEKSCSCSQPDNDYDATVLPAMSFIQKQTWREIYKYDCGFMRGTIFAELDKPWRGKRYAMGGCVR